MPAAGVMRSPVEEAEAARQVVGVLRRMEGRFRSGAWGKGARFLADGGNCLIGGIDEASDWTMPGVAEEVTLQLARQLPRPFRALAAIWPRAALAAYNDLVGGRAGALRLVRGALVELGVRPSLVELVPSQPTDHVAAA